ncbi:MAG TPA: fumarylacetoacetate hydrolase family protein, partial [Bryobacteraceae bacterium]|nr:fumarylacetoacetate hydrolase family protein [Bryobacteraceae bacterium]
ALRTPMFLVTFRRAGAAPEAGVLRGDRVISVSGAGYPDVLSIIQGGPEALKKIETWISQPRPAEPLAGVKLMAPIPRPPKFICIGLNYRDHAEETNMPIPAVPTVFNKFATAVIGPGDPIVLPKSSTRPDYEAELAFIIGKGGRYIAASDWREHVFGYTMVNDVSARDYQMATSQWLMGKTFDTFAPMGHCLATADEIADPHALDISLTLNGEVMQSSNTRNLIFRLPELVEFLSSVFTLEPGDVVSTGTPGGVGFARKPPVYLKPGDEVVVRVQGLGELRNPVISE